MEAASVPLALMPDTQVCTQSKLSPPPLFWHASPSLACMHAVREGSAAMPGTLQAQRAQWQLALHPHNATVSPAHLRPALQADLHAPDVNARRPSCRRPAAAAAANLTAPAAAACQRRAAAGRCRCPSPTARCCAANSTTRWPCTSAGASWRRLHSQRPPRGSACCAPHAGVRARLWGSHVTYMPKHCSNVGAGWRLQHGGCSASVEPSIWCLL